MGAEKTVSFPISLSLTNEKPRPCEVLRADIRAARVMPNLTFHLDGPGSYSCSLKAPFLQAIGFTN